MKFSIVTAYISQIETTIDLLDRLQEMKADNENIEIIVVNAGGQPISHPFINKRIDLPKNYSFSNSMNTGIRETTTDFIVVLNNDAFPTQKGWLTKLYEFWDDTKAMIICPNNTRPGLDKYNHLLIENKDSYAIMKMFPAICYFLPRDTIEKIGYFDERFIPAYYEDNDYCKRVLDAGGKIIVVKDIYIDHLLSKESSSANIDMNNVMKINYKRFIEKWKISSLETMTNIGLAVMTYNRLDYLEQCVESLERNNWGGANIRLIVDDCSTQKGYDEFLLSLGPNIKILRNSKNSGVATSKNRALEYMYKYMCEHLFIMEDDILMKSGDTCPNYIDYAKTNDLKHLNFGLHGPANKKKGYYNLQGIWVYPDCVGAFSYYHQDVIKNIGYMDTEFKNAWEHIWYTLKISEVGYTTPFWQFADVPNSHELLDEIPGSISNSIIRQRNDWLKNIKDGMSHAINKYGKWLPPRENVEYLTSTYMINDIQLETLCHNSCIQFGEKYLTKFEIGGKKVIEIGSLNINGGLRSHVILQEPLLYIGVDTQQGDGVDIVCNAEDIVDKFGKESFDIIISTEVLEHVRNWRKVISNIKNICKPDGIMLITTRSKGFPYHAYPNDYWRYELSDMDNIFSDCIIEKLESDKQRPGVFIKVQKPENFIEKNLSNYKLYNMVYDSIIESMIE